MTHPASLNKTLISLKIALILDILVAAFFTIGLVYNFTLLLSPDVGDYGTLTTSDIIIIMIIFGSIIMFKIAVAVFRGIVIRHLKRGLAWSRAAAIVLSILLILPTPNIPIISTVLGIIALVGLFDPATGLYFKPTTPASSAPTPSTKTL